MSDRHAPASFLIGLGESDSFFIGVQKDQIEMVEEGAQKGRHCLIKLGRPEEHFEIVRESKHVFVLKVQSGCAFTGDFQHAGVRNVCPGSDDDEKLQDLNERMQSLLKQTFRNVKEQTCRSLTCCVDLRGLTGFVGCIFPLNK